MIVAIIAAVITWVWIMAETDSGWVGLIAAIIVFAFIMGIAG